MQSDAQRYPSTVQRQTIRKSGRSVEKSGAQWSGVEMLLDLKCQVTLNITLVSLDTILEIFHFKYSI